MSAFVKRLGHETVALEIVNGVARLRNQHSGVTAELTPFEARCFERASEARLQEFFFAHGGLADGTEPTSELGVIALGLAHGLPTRDELACLIDSTTLATSLSIMHPAGHLAPGQLLDLATLCFAVTMYDSVLVDVESVKIPIELEGIVLPLRNREDGKDHRHYYYAVDQEHAIRKVGNHQMLAGLEHAWTEFLGQQVTISYEAMDDETDSPGNWEYIPGNLFGKGWDPVSSHHLDSLDAEVSVQTWRYFVNERTASLLDVPYHCTSLRYPAARLALQHQATYRRLADDLLSHLLGRPAIDAAKVHDGPFLRRVRLPHPLSIVIGKARTRDEILLRLLKLRDRFTAVREWMRAAKLSDADTDELTRLLGLVFSKHELATAIDNGIGLASNVPGASLVDAAGATAVLKAASTIRPTERAAQALVWLRRPEVGVLRSFRAEASGLAASTDSIARLWPRTPIDRTWLDAALRLSEAGALDAAALRPDPAGITLSDAR